MNMFNVKEEIEKITQFIRNYYNENNLKGVVIGISGGKDSAVVAALFTKALGPENVIGFAMPCHSKNADKNDAEIISNHFGFELKTIDLTNVYDSFKKNIGNYDSDLTIDSDINLKPRLRMATLYYNAALYSKVNNGTYIVAGTGNKCEIYVGYFTKGGDGMSDINVIANYTVSEVIEIGKYLGVPNAVLYKEPSDGLSELNDEEKLGVTYKEIEEYMAGNPANEKSKKLIKTFHDRSRHKKGTIIYKREI